MLPGFGHSDSFWADQAPAGTRLINSFLESGRIDTSLYKPQKVDFTPEVSDASLGKGFGSCGGILMLGTAEQEDLVRRHAQSYVFSGAPNLASIGGALGSAAVHATDEIRDLQAALATRVRAFDSHVATPERGSLLPIRMVEVGDEHETIAAARRLLDHGYYAAAVFFPAVAQGRAGIRVCLTATHSLDEIEGLCTVVGGGGPA